MLDLPLTSDALRDGFLALRSALREWGVSDQHALLNWLRQEGHRCGAPGAYFNSQAQMTVLQRAAQTYPVVMAIETSYAAAVCIFQHNAHAA